MTGPSDPATTMRRDAMSVLSRSTTDDISALMTRLTVPPHDDLRTPESGLVMLRGRIGGDGAAFNLGEATVARAAVRLAGGEVGVGYALGRDGAKARMIAICDALIQSPDHRPHVEAHVVEPLRAKLESALAQQAAETAATRVDFYTLVRGEG